MTVSVVSSFCSIVIRVWFQKGTEDMELEDWMIFKYSDKEPREFRKQAEAIEAAATQIGEPH